MNLLNHVFLQTFHEKEELLRNMMGLLGNVAEVKWLRPNLMTSEFIKVFSDLLDSISDGIEVGYKISFPHYLTTQITHRLVIMQLES